MLFAGTVVRTSPSHGFSWSNDVRKTTSALLVCRDRTIDHAARNKVSNPTGPANPLARASDTCAESTPARSPRQGQRAAQYSGTLQIGEEILPEGLTAVGLEGR